jgi:hypothetical protein
MTSGWLMIAALVITGLMATAPALAQQQGVTGALGTGSAGSTPPGLNGTTSTFGTSPTTSFGGPPTGSFGSAGGPTPREHRRVSEYDAEQLRHADDSPDAPGAEHRTRPTGTSPTVGGSTPLR